MSLSYIQLLLLWRFQWSPYYHILFYFCEGFYEAPNVTFNDFHYYGEFHAATYVTFMLFFMNVSVDPLILPPVCIIVEPLLPLSVFVTMEGSMERLMSLSG